MPLMIVSSGIQLALHTVNNRLVTLGHESSEALIISFDHLMESLISVTGEVNICTDTIKTLRLHAQYVY